MSGPTTPPGTTSIRTGVSRRNILTAMGAGVGAAALSLRTNTAARAAPGATEIDTMANTPLLAYVGCRTTKERGARGEGIRVFKVAADGGRWEPVQLVGDLVNPSFLAFNKSKDRLYTVHGDGNTATSFAVEAGTGKLTKINAQSTGGGNPVHLAVDPTGKFLVVANYASGNVAVLPVEADGALGQLRPPVDLPGEPGPHRVEQKGSHPHEVVFDPSGRFVIAPDKGLDAIFVLGFDADAGVLSIHGKTKTREGAGPRHVVFAPGKPFAYVVDELDSSVTAYAWDGAKGELTPLQALPSTPAAFTGDNRAAEIAISPDGRFVFVSNRGHDSVGTFAVDPASGVLAAVSWAKTGGRGPRFITTDPTGRFVYAANELTDSIVQLAVAPGDGRLDATGLKVDTGSPVCVAFKAAG